MKISFRKKVYNSLNCPLSSSSLNQKKSFFLNDIEKLKVNLFFSPSVLKNLSFSQKFWYIDLCIFSLHITWRKKPAFLSKFQCWKWLFFQKSARKRGKAKTFFIRKLILVKGTTLFQLFYGIFLKLFWHVFLAFLSLDLSHFKNSILFLASLCD